MLWPRERFRLALALAICFAVRLVIFFFSYNYDGDFYARVMGSLAWAQHPYYIAHADSNTWVFGPLQFYLFGLALMVWDNIRFAPRVVSLILGSLAVVPMYKLARIRFGSDIAWLAAIAFCFYTLQVRYSTVAASEGMNSFFIVAAAYLFIKYLADNRITTLVLAAVTVCLATMIRYENVMFIGLFAAFMIVRTNPEAGWSSLRIDLRKNNVGRVILFGVLASAYILSRFLSDYIVFGDFLHSIPLGAHAKFMESSLERRGMLWHYIYTAAYWPGIAILTLTPIYGIFAFFGAFWDIVKGKHIVLSLSAVIILLVYMWQSTVAETMFTMSRFSLTFGLFFLPFGAMVWYKLASNAGRHIRRWLNTAILATIVGFFLFTVFYAGYGTGSAVRDKIDTISPVSRLPVYVMKVRRWIDNNVGSTQTILLDDRGFDFPFVTFYGNLPMSSYRVARTEKHPLDTSILYPAPDYVVYRDGGSLKSVLPLDPKADTQEVMGLKLIKRFSTAHYTIFQVQNPGAVGRMQPAKDPEPSQLAGEIR